MSTIGFHSHNHDQCIADTLSTADAHCAEEGLQFTPVRRRVLEILLAEHKAMGAYDILPTLAHESGRHHSLSGWLLCLDLPQSSAGSVPCGTLR